MFGISSLILVASSILSYISLGKLLDSQSWVQHTIAVESVLENTISKMKDAETGQWGYLLTGNETFLEPYAGSRNFVDACIDSVALLTRDNPLQQKEIPVLRTLVKAKYLVIEGTIAGRRANKSVPTEVLLHGKDVMDSLRRVVDRMVIREKKLMEARNAIMDRFAASTPIAVAIGVLAAMVITFFFYFRVLKGEGEAELVRADLEEANRRTQRSIEVVDKAAKRIASGDYHTRIDSKDLDGL